MGQMPPSEKPRLNLEETIRQLREDAPRLFMRAKFTITPLNFSKIEDTVAYAKKQGLLLSLKLIDNLQSYTNSMRYDDNERNGRFDFQPAQKQQIIRVLSELLKQGAVDKFMSSAIIDFLKKGEINRTCFVPLRTRFVSAEGNIYGCRKKKAVGNINTKSADIFKNRHR